MRTLNKALALILALVMVLGLGAFSVSADDATAAEETAEAKEFSDATDIKYDEAAAVLSTLGIMEGRDDGTFDPKAELNRQEGAVMITRLLGVNPTVGTSYFTDIDNPFYQPYLAYVSNEGIIAGYGDGTFGPYDKLTGVAFAKMLLGALGYDASIEGLVGPMWELSVQKLVRSVELDDGLSGLDLTAPVTREIAAHMLLNALQKPMVKYDSQTTVAVNGAVVNIGNSNAEYVTNNSVAKQTISHKTEVNTDWYLVEFAEEYWKDLKLMDDGETTDAFGRPSHNWYYKNAKIGEYNDISDLVGIYTAKLEKKALYELVGIAAYESIKNNGSVLRSYIDGVTLTPCGGEEVNGVFVRYAGDYEDYMSKNDTRAVNDTDNGDVTEVYLTSDNNVRLVTYHTFVYEVANSYNASSKSVNIIDAGNTGDWGINLTNRRLDEDDFPEIKNLKAGDRVLVNVAAENHSAAGAVYEVKTVIAAPSVTGKVEGYRNDGSYDVTIDGKTYKYNHTANGDVRDKKYSVGQNATVAMDLYDNVIDVLSSLTVNDYVFIREFSPNSNLYTVSSAYASAVFADGTSSTIRVRNAVDYNTGKTETSQGTIADWGVIKAYQKKAVDAKDAYTGFEDGEHAGQFYTFTKNSSNEYTLYAVEKNRYNAFDLGYGDFANPIEDGDTVKVLESDKVYFVAENTAHPGADFPTLPTTWDEDEVALSTISVKLDKSVKANNDTVLIIDDGTGKLTRYEGVKNLPSVTLNGDGNRRVAAQVYVCVNEKLYVKMAYVKLWTSDNSKNGYTVKGSSDAKLVYVKEYDSAVYSGTAETSWKYIIINSKGEEETIVADQKIAGYNDKYTSYNYVTKNGNLYTEFELADDSPNNDGIIVVKTGTSIGVDGGVITFNKTRSYTATDNAEIMLVVTDKNCKALNPTGKYGVYTGLSLSQMNDLIKNYTISYHAEGELDDVGGNILRKLYVTVESAVADGATAAQSDSIIIDPSASVYGNIGNNTYVVSTLVVEANEEREYDSLLIRNGGELVNSGTITVGKFTVQNGGKVTNGGTIVVTGTTNIYGHVDSYKTFVGMDGGLISGDSFVAHGSSSVSKFGGTFKITGTFDTSEGTAVIEKIVLGDGAKVLVNTKKTVIGSASVTGDDPDVTFNGTEVKTTDALKTEIESDLEQPKVATIELAGKTGYVTGLDNAFAKDGTYTVVDDTSPVTVSWTNSENTGITYQIDTGSVNTMTGKSGTFDVTPSAGNPVKVTIGVPTSKTEG